MNLYRKHTIFKKIIEFIRTFEISLEYYGFLKKIIGFFKNISLRRK